LADERSNLTEIKMDMLEDLHGQLAQYVHTRYLLDKLVFTKQGITGEKDCFKHLRIFESLLGPKMKSTFASLLSRAVEEVFKHKGRLTTKTHIARLKKDPSLFEALLNNKGNSKIKLLAEAGMTDEEKDAYFLQRYQKFERYVYWFLGEMVFKDHRNSLNNHKDYVLNDIVKPKLISVIAYYPRVNYMFKIIPYLQAPTNKGETARHADYGALSPEVDAKQLLRAQYLQWLALGLSKQD
jgi:hypothetical protein